MPNVPFLRCTVFLLSCFWVDHFVPWTVFQLDRFSSAVFLRPFFDVLSCPATMTYIRSFPRVALDVISPDIRSRR